MKSREFQQKIQDGDVKSFVLELAYAVRSHEISKSQFESILEKMLSSPNKEQLLQKTTSVIMFQDPLRWDSTYKSMLMSHIAVGDVNEELLRHWAKVCGLKGMTRQQAGILGLSMGGLCSVAVCVFLSLDWMEALILCVGITCIAGAVGWLAYR